MAYDATTSPRLKAHIIKTRCQFLRTAVSNLLEGTFDTGAALEALGSVGYLDELDRCSKQLIAAIELSERDADALLAKADKVT